MACGLLLTMRINSGGPLTAQNNNTDEREGNGELFSENGREGKQRGTLVLPFVSNDVGQNFNPDKSIAVNSLCTRLILTHRNCTRPVFVPYLPFRCFNNYICGVFFNWKTPEEIEKLGIIKISTLLEVAVRCACFHLNR